MVSSSFEAQLCVLKQCSVNCSETLNYLGAIATTSGSFDQSKPKFFYGMNCSGTEGYILDCQIGEWGTGCTYNYFYQTADVICPPAGKVKFHPMLC